MDSNNDVTVELLLRHASIAIEHPSNTTTTTTTSSTTNHHHSSSTSNNNEDDENNNNNSRMLMMASLENDLQTVEQHLQRQTSFRHIIGGAGRAVRESITTALSSIRRRLDTAAATQQPQQVEQPPQSPPPIVVVDNNNNNNNSNPPSTNDAVVTMSLSHPSVTVRNFSQRLLAAETAHAHQIPLGHLQHQQEITTRMLSGSAQSRNDHTEDSIEIMSPRQDHDNEPLYATASSSSRDLEAATPSSSSTRRRPSSLLLPSRRKAEELEDIQTDHQRYEIRNSVLLTRSESSAGGDHHHDDEEGIEMLLDQADGVVAISSIDTSPIKKAPKVNDDNNEKKDDDPATDVDKVTPILLTQRSRANLHTSSHSVLFGYEDHMKVAYTTSDMTTSSSSSDTEIYSWGMGLTSLHDDTNARYDANNSKLDITSRIGRSEMMMISCSFGPKHTTCCDSNGKVYAKGVNDTGAVDPYRDKEEIVTRPVLVESLLGIARVIQVSCGVDHTVALRSDGTVLSWGSNEYGQLGHRVDNHHQYCKLPTFCRPSLMMVSAGNGRHRITNVACGDGYTLCLTSRMILLACGDELIAGYRKDGDILPAIIPTLMDLPIVAISAGRRHAAAITAHGTAFLWGENHSGCCSREYPRSFRVPISLNVPLSQRTSKGTPPPPPLTNWGYWDGSSSSSSYNSSATNSIVSIADDVAIVQAALGDDHTVLLTKSGRIFVCGSNDSGQLGLADTDANTTAISHLVPIDHPMKGKRFISAQAGAKHTLLLDDVGDVWQFDQSYDPQNPQPVLSKKRIQWIAAGGMNSVAVVSHHDDDPIIETNKHSVAEQQSDDNDICGEASLAHSVEDLLSLLDAKKKHVSASSSCPINGRPQDAVMTALATRIHELLKTPSVLNSLFLDPTELDDLYAKLLAANVPTHVEIIKSIESGIRSGLQSLDIDRTRLIFPEQVRFLLLYLQCPLFINWKRKDDDDHHNGGIHIMFDRRGDVIMSLCNAVLELPYEGYRALMSWTTTYSRENYIRFIIKPLLCQLGKGLSVSAGAETRAVPSIASVLKWLYNAADRAGNGIVPEDFHSDYISTMSPERLLDDLMRYKHASKEQRNTMFFLCNTPFLFSPITKRILLQMENEVNMFRTATAGARYNPTERVFEVHPFYVLEIDRAQLLSQTLEKISRARPTDLRKKLRISFKGEEGLDAGGVTREFFQLLSAQLFAVDTGMWTSRYQDETITWFNAECSWNDNGYFLSGILVGLAVYNSVVLGVHFPQAVYRKLLGLPLGLEDMVDDEIRSGLQSLLDYKGNDVEDVFCLTFDVAWMDLGVEKRRNLKPNGSNIAVTSENKEEYVMLYTRWLLQDSIYPQYDAFERGFMRVMEDSSFELLRAEELELLVAGSPDLDFDALRKNTTYEGYTEDSDVVKNFWKLISSASRDDQVHFLKFTTGSPKAPVGGLGNIQLKIQRAGPDSDYLPTAHTCFNTLLLPDYGSNYDKLSDRLGRAVLECEGFGLK